MDENLNVLKEELERINKILNPTLDESQNFDGEGFELIEKIKMKQVPEDISLNFLNSLNSYFFREYAIRNMGFALITRRFVKGLAKYIGSKKCLEILAGQGCLSKVLQDEGIDVIATDDYSWSNRLNLNNTWTNVENMDCLEAIRKYGQDVSYIICSWIPYGSPIGYDILKVMDEVNPNCKLIVIGEGPSGCTADDTFFENLEEIDTEEEFVKDFRSWSGIRDYVSIVKLKK